MKKNSKKISKIIAPVALATGCLAALPATSCGMHSSVKHIAPYLHEITYDDYTYDKETGKVTFLVSGDTTISAICPHVECSLTTNLSHCSINGITNPYDFEEIINLIIINLIIMS